jgi:hypothetical protein
MPNDKKSNNTSSTRSKKHGKKQQHFQRRGPGDQKKKGVPALQYGSTNNFHKFKEALSERAIKEYGHLGKLIEQGTYNVPTNVSR